MRLAKERECIEMVVACRSRFRLVLVALILLNKSMVGIIIMENTKKHHHFEIF
jgi:hypothetical protein